MNDELENMDSFNPVTGMSETNVIIDIFMFVLLILIIISGIIGYEKYGDTYQFVQEKKEKKIEEKKERSILALKSLKIGEFSENKK